MGYGRLVITLATAVCGERWLWDSRLVESKPRPTLWGNSLIIGNNPAASAGKHILIHKMMSMPKPRYDGLANFYPVEEPSPVRRFLKDSLSMYLENIIFK